MSLPNIYTLQTCKKRIASFILQNISVKDEKNIKICQIFSHKLTKKITISNIDIDDIIGENMFKFLLSYIACSVP